MIFERTLKYSLYTLTCSFYTLAYVLYTFVYSVYTTYSIYYRMAASMESAFQDPAVEGAEL